MITPWKRKKPSLVLAICLFFSLFSVSYCHDTVSFAVLFAIIFIIACYLTIKTMKGIKLLARRYYTRRNFLKRQRFSIESVEKLFINRCEGKTLLPNEGLTGRLQECLTILKDSLFPLEPYKGGCDYETRSYLSADRFLKMKQLNKLSKPTLVLDLDETLIFSSTIESSIYKRDLKLPVRLDKTRLSNFFVSFRPHLQKFLSQAARWYEIVVFTASERSYAEPLIQAIDRENLISRRFYRDSCSLVNGCLLKDLSVIRDNLSRVLIIDNSPMSLMNLENVLPVKSWTGHDKNDEELLELLQLLEVLRFVPDVREVLSLRPLIIPAVSERIL